MQPQTEPMTRADLIEALKERGVTHVFGRPLSRCLKHELELAYHRLSLEARLPHLSFTQVRMYLRCGRQFWYRYVKGLVIPPSGSAVVGRSIHRAIEHDLTTALLSGTHEPADVLEDVYAEEFRLGREEADWRTETPERAFETGRRTLRTYVPTLHRIEPFAVEETFEIPLPALGHNLKGVVDLVALEEGRPVIVEHKVLTRRPGRLDKDLRLQLAIYTLAKRANVIGANVLVRKQTPEVAILRDAVSDEDRRWALGLLTYVADGIYKNHFPPADPSSWVCTPEWCGYWEICRKEMFELFN